MAASSILSTLSHRPLLPSLLFSAKRPTARIFLPCHLPKVADNPRMSHISSKNNNPLDDLSKPHTSSHGCREPRTVHAASQSHCIGPLWPRWLSFATSPFHHHPTALFSEQWRSQCQCQSGGGGGAREGAELISCRADALVQVPETGRALDRQKVVGIGIKASHSDRTLSLLCTRRGIFPTCSETMRLQPICFARLEMPIFSVTSPSKHQTRYRGRLPSSAPAQLSSDSTHQMRRKIRLTSPLPLLWVPVDMLQPFEQ